MVTVPTPFTELVGCDVPIQLAGMGGVSTPLLCAAVSAAGGLGMLGGSGSGDVVADVSGFDEIGNESGRPSHHFHFMK